MKDYKLTKDEQKILDYLELKVSKSRRNIGHACKMCDFTVKDTLKSLKEMGLAEYSKQGKSHLWYAL